MIHGGSSGFLNLAGIQCIGDVWWALSSTLWSFNAGRGRVSIAERGGRSICDDALKVALISSTVAALLMRTDSGMVKMFQEEIFTFGREVHRIQSFTSIVHNIKYSVLFWAHR